MGVKQFETLTLFRCKESHDRNNYFSWVNELLSGDGQFGTSVNVRRMRDGCAKKLSSRCTQQRANNTIIRHSRYTISCAKADRKFPRYKVRRVYRALFITQRDQLFCSFDRVKGMISLFVAARRESLSRSYQITFRAVIYGNSLPGVVTSTIVGAL